MKSYIQGNLVFWDEKWMNSKYRRPINFTDQFNNKKNEKRFL